MHENRKLISYFIYPPQNQKTSIWAPEARRKSERRVFLALLALAGGYEFLFRLIVHHTVCEMVRYVSYANIDMYVCVCVFHSRIAFRACGWKISI